MEFVLVLQNSFTLKPDLDLEKDHTGDAHHSTLIEGRKAANSSGIRGVARIF